MKIIYHSIVGGALAFLLALFIHDYFNIDFNYLLPFILFAVLEAGAPDTDITKRGSIISIIAYELLGVVGLKRGHRESFHQLSGIIAYTIVWLLIIIPLKYVLAYIADKYGISILLEIEPYMYSAFAGSVFTFMEHIFFDTSTRQGIVVFGKRLRGLIKYNYTDDELTAATVTGGFAVLFLILSFDIRLAYAAIAAFVFAHLYVPWSWRMIKVRKKKLAKKR